MKLVLFGEEFSLGILSGDSVIDASSVADTISHHSPQELMSSLIADFDRHRGALEQLAGGGAAHPRRKRAATGAAALPAKTGVHGRQLPGARRPN